MSSSLKKLESTTYMCTMYFHSLGNLKMINIFSIHSCHRNAAIITWAIIKPASCGEVKIKYE